MTGFTDAVAQTQKPKRRWLQIHVLTPYPPSNLNRDDQGRPKTAMVCGVPRLRISSQALKRAWRTSDVFSTTLAGYIGTRTARFGATIVSHLTERKVSPDIALAAAREVAQHFGKLNPPKDPNPARTRQLAFISPDEQTRAFAAAEQIAKDIKSGKFTPTADDDDDNGDSSDNGRRPKAKKKAGAIAADALLLQADTAADIAMFGRMLADNAAYNRDAAVAVSHAFTTHRVTIEDDFYVALDDLKPKEEDVGAGFMGEQGFGSGVFYLYACVNLVQLHKNLDNNAELAGRACEALIEAMTAVSPSGKQASFAAFSRAHYVLAERGSAQPCTLAGAFYRPVTGEDLIASSIDALRSWRGKLDAAYGPAASDTYEFDVAAGLGRLDELREFCGRLA